MAEHAEHDEFQQKYVGLVAIIIAGAVFLAGFIGVITFLR